VQQTCRHRDRETWIFFGKNARLQRENNPVAYAIGRATVRVWLLACRRLRGAGFGGVF